MADILYGFDSSFVTTDAAGNAVAGVALSVHTTYSGSNPFTATKAVNPVTLLPGVATGGVVTSDSLGRVGFFAQDYSGVLYLRQGANSWPINPTDHAVQTTAVVAGAIAGKADVSDLVPNARTAAGVDPTGVTECAAALQTYLTANAAGDHVTRIFGTFKIASTVTITGNVDASGATFNWTGPSGGVAVQVGTASAGVRIDRKTITLPRIVNTRKAVAGWAETGVAGTTGVRIINANSCIIYVPHVASFETGLHLKGQGQGTAYTTVHIGHLDNNKVNQLLDADATGWCNSNTFVGGRFSHNSNEGVAVAGVKHIMLALTASLVNCNEWLNPSLEAIIAEYTLDCYGTQNHWIGARWEHDTGARVHWGESASRNQILWGYGAQTIVEVFGASHGQGNSILTSGTWRLRAATQTSPILVAENSSAAASPVDVIMAPGAASAGSDPLAAYTVSRSSTLTKMKRSTDAADRLQLDHLNGTVIFGNGSAASTRSLGNLGTTSIAVNGAHLVSGTDAANDLGIASFRFRNLNQSGGQFVGIRTATATTTVGVNDSTVLMNAAGATVINLPTPVGITGRVYTLRNIGAGTATVTPAAGTVDAAANQALVAGAKLTYQSDGANWWTI